ncbi:MAG: Rnase Y domain-containing protein, partial [Anaerovoracaceae bacterium]
MRLYQHLIARNASLSYLSIHVRYKLNTTNLKGGVIYMTDIVLAIIVGIVALLIGILVGYIIRKNLGEKAIGSAETKAKNIILDAENRSETIKKEIALEAKEDALKYKNEAEREIKERRNELSKSENRLLQKEESIDKKLENIERKEQSITAKEENVTKKQKELDELHQQLGTELERISGYTREEAKAILLEQVESEIRVEASQLIR